MAFFNQFSYAESVKKIHCMMTKDDKTFLMQVIQETDRWRYFM